MKTCPQCKALMHEQSPSCPACDHRFERGPGRGLLALAALLVAGAAVAAWMWLL